ncbi:MAG: hypothetical protein KatS3mg049_2076 [Caldilinea sp.]|nr:MAG: hypothetical protein KatS3mg049_2076 [Caldilinea sp.]
MDFLWHTGTVKVRTGEPCRLCRTTGVEVAVEVGGEVCCLHLRCAQEYLHKRYGADVTLLQLVAYMGGGGRDDTVG